MVGFGTGELNGHRNQFCVDAPGLGKFVCDAAHPRAYEVPPDVLPELVFVHSRALRASAQRRWPLGALAATH